MVFVFHPETDDQYSFEREILLFNFFFFFIFPPIVDSMGIFTTNPKTYIKSVTDLVQ